jgi:RNA polymerase sigma-70 factor (family 1)
MKPELPSTGLRFFSNDVMFSRKTAFSAHAHPLPLIHLLHMALSEIHTEKQWLDALVLGDEKAFTLIYHAHWKALFSVAYTTTKSREVAQELVQEVFVSLWVNRNNTTIQTNLKAYLCGAVRNKVFDYYDKQKVRERYKNTVVQETSLVINSTEETIAFEEISSLVDQQIKTLPETTRKIFILSRIKGFSIPEIATELSLSVKTVEYHLTKALKHLRLHLTEYSPRPVELMLLTFLALY